MEKVQWKTFTFGNADAQKVYEEIGDKNTSAEEIVEKAKDPNTELHKCFEWDDSIAAHKYRLQQARSIMCNLVFVSDDKDYEPVRVFHITTEKTVYKPTKLIIQKPDEYQALLARAKAELQEFRKRYKIIQELETLFALIDEL